MELLNFQLKSRIKSNLNEKSAFAKATADAARLRQGFGDRRVTFAPSFHSGALSARGLRPKTLQLS